MRPPLAQNMNYTIVINGAVWGGALAYYYIDAHKWFTGTYLPHTLITFFQC